MLSDRFPPGTAPKAHQGDDARILGQLRQDAAALVDIARNTPRDPRSREYWHGVETAAFRRLAKLAGVALPPLASPYPMGTAHADAFYSGMDEGHRLAARENRPLTMVTLCQETF